LRRSFPPVDHAFSLQEKTFAFLFDLFSLFPVPLFFFPFFSRFATAFFPCAHPLGGLLFLFLFRAFFLFPPLQTKRPHPPRCEAIRPGFFFLIFFFFPPPPLQTIGSSVPALPSPPHRGRSPSDFVFLFSLRFSEICFFFPIPPNGCNCSYKPFCLSQEIPFLPLFLFFDRILFFHSTIWGLSLSLFFLTVGYSFPFLFFPFSLVENLSPLRLFFPLLKIAVFFSFPRRVPFFNDHFSYSFPFFRNLPTSPPPPRKEPLSSRIVR